MGTVKLMLSIGANKVAQEFIVCRELRRNIILDVDFAKRNYAGIQWTTNKTSVLSLNGEKVVEVKEDVTASYHVRVPPRHNAVFEVNIHAEIQGTQVIMGNKHLIEKHPNMYQHEVAIVAEENSERFPLLAITNLDHVKTLHLAKGEVVGFARPESSEVTYIATTNELNIEEEIDVMPRNWIPQRKWVSQDQTLQLSQAMHSNFRDHSRKLQPFPKIRETEGARMPRKDITSTFQESKRESEEHFQKSRWQSTEMGMDRPQNANDCVRKCEFKTRRTISGMS